MSGKQLRAHFLSLVDELGAIFDVRPDLCLESGQWPDDEDETCGLAVTSRLLDFADDVGIVMLSREPTTRVSYILGLHELGHLALRRLTSGGFSSEHRLSVQREEEKAWRWALEHSAIEPTPCEWHEIAWRLRTYYEDGQNRHYRRFLREAERNAHALGTPGVVRAH